MEEGSARSTNDLCTPAVVLEALAGLGEIALDPCSNRWSQVAARVKLDGSPGQCGLEADWRQLSSGGLVYVNPPYGRGHMSPWARKIAEEAAKGCEVVALVKGDHSTVWWRLLRKHASAICYWEGRIAFDGGAHGSGNFASALLYFGPCPHLFAHHLSRYGDVRLLR